MVISGNGKITAMILLTETGDQQNQLERTSTVHM